LNPLYKQIYVCCKTFNCSTVK